MRTRHSRRHERRLRRGGGPAQIILTSLIDIFTVLLFFLLIHAANVEVLPEPRDLDLPESVAQEKTRKTPVVMVTRREIFLEGRRVVGSMEALKAEHDNIPALQAVLTVLPKETLAAAPAGGKPDEPPAITIMGDKLIPYRLLRKVMQSCTDAGYSRISLAVMRTS